MSALIERSGNLFDSTCAVIGHGVNTCGVMGAGIAVNFKNRWPAMFEDYSLRCAAGLLHPGQVYGYRLAAGDRWSLVVNIASQDRPGAHARLDWLETATRKAVRAAQERHLMSVNHPALKDGACGTASRGVAGLIFMAD